MRHQPPHNSLLHFGQLVVYVTAGCVLCCWNVFTICFGRFMVILYLKGALTETQNSNECGGSPNLFALWVLCVHFE